MHTPFDTLSAWSGAQMDHCCFAKFSVKNCRNNKVMWNITLSFLQWKQSQKWQQKNAAEVVCSDLLQGTKNALQPHWRITGISPWQSFHASIFRQCCWYLNICINRNPLNKKLKWKLDILKLHDLHAMLNINAVWYNCRLLHTEKNPSLLRGKWSMRRITKI